MKLDELKKEIQQYQYFEDMNIIDVSLASIIATRVKLGDPIWLVIIGPSSGGKSQILGPLSLTDPKFLHRIDDVTENTFLSGMKTSGGKDMSLLNRIGSKGMIVISDLTVLFSKAAESRATILSQFRMIYDGEMIKYAGNQEKPISWKGYLGILAGSTPSIYRHFEEVADMGERFIYYKMKEYDAEKATHLSMSRKMFGRELDDKLALHYAKYIQEVTAKTIAECQTIELSETVKSRILKIALFAERVRTTAHFDFMRKDMTRIPIPAMPMRVALQLTAIAKGLAAIRNYENGSLELGEVDMEIIDWCGYSLANEEKRACLRFMAHNEFDVSATTQMIADHIGLSTDVIKSVLQNLSAVGILIRTGDSGSLTWKIAKKSDWELVRSIEKIVGFHTYKNRQLTVEEGNEIDEAVKEQFEAF